MNIESLNLAESKEALHVAIETRANLCLEGDPGVGKTALIASLASELGAHFRTMIGSAMAPEDTAMPVRNDTTRTIERWILGPIAELNKLARETDKPAILFLDEITDTSRAVWSALQRLINEREVGDEKLHERISILMACNSARIATGGQDLSWPVVGRISFVRLIPEIREIADVFLSILAPRTSGTLSALLADYGASLDIMPELCQRSPPDAPEAGPWAAPRSAERGLRLMAGAMDRGAKPDSKIVRALLTGSIGPDAALAYLGLYAVRASLPSMKEICADPSNAKLPGKATFAACAGVIAQVGQIDAHAGWIYTQRLSDEARLVAGRILVRSPRGKPTSPHASAGAKARVQLEAEIGKAQRLAA